MAIQTLKIPIGNNFIKKGDTIKEINFSFDVTDNIDLTGATIRMDLFYQEESILSISNGNGITIVDSKNFNIDEIPYTDNDLPIGNSIGDLEITDTNGVRLTYFNVTFTIIKEYTV